VYPPERQPRERGTEGSCEERDCSPIEQITEPSWQQRTPLDDVAMGAACVIFCVFVGLHTRRKK
jgi:hypothetical protein